MWSRGSVNSFPQRTTQRLATPETAFCYYTAHLPYPPTPVEIESERKEERKKREKKKKQIEGRCCRCRSSPPAASMLLPARIRKPSVVSWLCRRAMTESSATRTTRLSGDE